MAIEFVGGWQPLAVAAATLSFLIVGAVFCAGAVFDLRGLRAWAKNEFFQVVISSLLIAFLMAFATGLTAFSQELTGGNEPIVFAQQYLRSMNANITIVSSQVLAFSMIISALRDITVSLEPLGVGISARPLAGLNPIVNDVEFVLSALSFVSLTNDVQDVLFLFIASTMMYYFLPVGVILRTFPLTRRVGAFMIAVAVGLYFVFPLTYVFNVAALERTNALIDTNAESIRAFIEQYDLEKFKFLNPLDLSTFVVSLFASEFLDVVLNAIHSLAVLTADLTIQTTFFPLFNLGVVLLFTISLYSALSSEAMWFSWS